MGSVLDRARRIREVDAALAWVVAEFADPVEAPHWRADVNANLMSTFSRYYGPVLLVFMGNGDMLCRYAGHTVLLDFDGTAEHLDSTEEPSDPVQVAQELAGVVVGIIGDTTGNRAWVSHFLNNSLVVSRRFGPFMVSLYADGRLSCWGSGGLSVIFTSGAAPDIEQGISRAEERALAAEEAAVKAAVDQVAAGPVVSDEPTDVGSPGSAAASSKPEEDLAPEPEVPDPFVDVETMHGTPGKGLGLFEDDSTFSAGRAGEVMFAESLLDGGHLEHVRSYWSMGHPDPSTAALGADVDLVVDLGDELWLVDAKNFAGHGMLKVELDGRHCYWWDGEQEVVVDAFAMSKNMSFAMDRYSRLFKDKVVKGFVVLVGDNPGRNVSDDMCWRKDARLPVLIEADFIEALAGKYGDEVVASEDPRLVELLL